MKKIYMIGILCLLALAACGVSEELPTYEASSPDQLVGVTTEEIILFCGNIDEYMSGYEPSNFTTVEQFVSDMTARMGYAICNDDLSEIVVVK